MQEIMYRASSNIREGIASFEFNPTEAHAQAHQPLLPVFDEVFHSLNGLEHELMREFAGRRVTFEQAFKEHHIGKPYIQKNYREAFRNLEVRGKIVAEVPVDKRKKRKGQLTLTQVPFIFPSASKKPRE